MLFYQYSQYSWMSGFILIEVIDRVIPVKQRRHPGSLQLPFSDIPMFPGEGSGLSFSLRCCWSCPVDAGQGAPVAHGSCASMEWFHGNTGDGGVLLPCSRDILGIFWELSGTHISPHVLKNPMCINYLTLMSSNCPVFPGMPTMDTHGFSIFPG